MIMFRLENRREYLCFKDDLPHLMFLSMTTYALKVRSVNTFPTHITHIPANVTDA